MPREVHNGASLFEIAFSGTTNCHLYHYAGNNPVRYTDPDGSISQNAIQIFRFVSTRTTRTLALSASDGILPIGDIVAIAWIAYDIYNFSKNTNQLAEKRLYQKKINSGSSSPNTSFSNNQNDEIPDEDKDKIARHSKDGDHGYGLGLDDVSEEGIRKKIDDILMDPGTICKTRKKDGAKLYMDPEGNALIYNPSADDKGTVFYPEKNGPEKFWENFGNDTN